MSSWLGQVYSCARLPLTTPLTEWLQAEFYFLALAELEVQDQGNSRVGFPEASLWFIDGRLFSVSSLDEGIPGVSLCVLSSFPYNDTSQTGLGPTVTGLFLLN